MKHYEREYRGARLRVEINDKMETYLYINGIQRDSDSPTSTGYCSLVSTIQTDYEWHELIRAEVNISGSEVVIKLSANNKTLGKECFRIDTKS